MRQLLLFKLLFLANFSLSQVETIRIEKERREQDYYPQIEGVFTGEIDILTLASPQGLTTGAGWEIISFTLSYPSGRDFKTVTLTSNVFPDNIIRELVRSALKEQIFLTEITATDQGGTKHLLRSMILIPVPSDEN